MPTNIKAIGLPPYVVDAKFATYTGFHKDRSSDVTLLPTGGIVRKDKPERNKSNSLREFFALLVWDRVLKAHANPNLAIVSPKPIAIDQGGKIYMSFVPGVTAGVVASRGFPRETGLTRLQRKEACRDFMVRLGRLFALKELEGIVHGDFQLRHLLYSVTASTLGVIDVENSQKALPSEVTRENRVMQDAVTSRMPLRGKWKKAYLDGIDEGRASMEGLDSQIKDIAAQIKSELAIPRLNFGAL